MSYRIWVSPERTVLITLWSASEESPEQMTVATRSEPGATWGPPVTVVEEATE